MTTPEASAPPAAAPRRRKAARASAAEVAARCENPPARLSLPADAGIEGVAALHAEALSLSAAPTLTVDAAAVQRLHTGTLQLLAALVRDRRRAGLPTDWHQPTAIVHASARVLGLTSLLELPPELP